MKTIIIIASILAALNQEVKASGLSLHDDLFNQVSQTKEGKDKRRLWLVKSNGNSKKIPKHLRIKAWTDLLSKPLKGRYHILSDSTIQIDSMVLNIHDIQKLSTITIPSVLGVIAIYGGVAYLLVVPGKFLALALTPIDGDSEPFENAEKNLISAAVLMTGGEILSRPFTSKKIGKWRVMIKDNRL